MAQLVLNDGLGMAYADVGEGRPLLLVHGWGASRRFFEPQIQALSARFRVIAPDLRAHGASPSPIGLPTMELLAADLVTLAERLELEDAVAVGWSMGAMALWRALPMGLDAHLAGMAVVDMTPRIVNDADWSLGLKGGYDLRAVGLACKAMVADWPAYVAALARAITAEGLEAERTEIIAWAAAEAARNAPAPLAHLWASLAGQDFRAELEGFELPTLIAHGALSQLYGPQTSAYLEARLPDARRVVFERSGHAPHLEEPERFNQAITEFASGLIGRGQRQTLRSAGSASKP